MRKSFLLIDNPAAGRRRHALQQATLAVLASRGAAVEAVHTSHPTHATAIASEAAARTDFDALIVAGGDGSIREAAKGLLGADLPLGIIPSGTGNVLAFELGLRRTPQAIADYLMTGSTCTITPSLANSEPFLLMAGIGFDAAVVAGVNAQMKRLFGKAAFALPTLRALFSQAAATLHVTLDETPLDAGWIIATRSSRYAGRMVVTRNTSIRDGRLELIAITAPTRRALASVLSRLARGRLAGDGVVARIGKKVVIECDTPVPVQIDGDLFGTTPLTIEPGDKSIKLIVP